MSAYVVRNGDWYLSEGPSWAVSTWVQDVRHATKYDSFATARGVVKEAIEHGHRPFGERPETAHAVRASVKRRSR